MNTNNFFEKLDVDGDRTWRGKWGGGGIKYGAVK